MAGQGTQVLSTDYNVIQSKVALVMGTGSDDYGYGQAFLSSQVAQRSRITATQWTNLRTDLLRCRQHQIGGDLSSLLTVPSRAIPLTNADYVAYGQLADTISTFSNRTSVPPSTEATRENLVAPQQRLLPWSGDLTQTVTVTFANYDQARYFFNSGSQIEFSASRSGGGVVYSAGTKNYTWSTMFSQMSTIQFGHGETASTNTVNGGTGSSIGFYNLTTTDQLIFSKLAPAGAYAANKYYIYAKINSDKTQITFKIEFRDDATGSLDESVTGTLTSTVQVYRASGANVSVSAPSANTVGISESYTPPPPPTYSISQSATSINEGSSVTYYITTTNFGSGTLYWSNVGSTIASDFTDNANSGFVNISNNSGTITRTLTNDTSTEGSENIVLQLRTGSVSGTIVGTASTVTVADTSTTPVVPPTPTYSIAPNTSSVNEGGTITYTVTTTNFGSGTLYWSNVGSTVASDFTDSYNSGSINIVNDHGTFTRTLTNDNTTEGTESVSVYLRTGSAVGAIVAIASTVQVADTSTTPYVPPPPPPAFVTTTSFGAGSGSITRSYGSTWTSGGSFGTSFVVTCTSGAGIVNISAVPFASFASCSVSPSTFYLSNGQSQTVSFGGAVPANSITNPWTFTATVSSGGFYSFTIYRV